MPTEILKIRGLYVKNHLIRRMAQKQVKICGVNEKVRPMLSVEFDGGELKLTAFKVDKVLHINICNVHKRFDMVTLSGSEFLTWSNQTFFMQESILHGGTRHGLSLDFIKSLELFSIRSEMKEFINAVRIDGLLNAELKRNKVRFTEILLGTIFDFKAKFFKSRLLSHPSKFNWLQFCPLFCPLKHLPTIW